MKLKHSTTPTLPDPQPVRLERSGAWGDGDWLRDELPVNGVARLRASLKERAYTRHRHDTYTIALTERGVQEFEYRHQVHRSLPGQVVVLHPDEAHDGRPATPEGFAYRSIYLDPARVHDAVRFEAGASAGLPFVADPVLNDPLLARAVAGAFGAPLEPLGADELLHVAGLSLLRAARSVATVSKRRALSDVVLARAREFLDANTTRVVTSTELEDACGETRFTIGAQFKRRYGTSPYRYLLMRRLAFVRAQLREPTPLAELAQLAGFADQAHMTRLFKAAYGMTPDVYGGLCRTGG